MIYEVRARLLFDNEDESRDFYHDCEVALAKASVINPDQENLEFSSVELINNNHDQNPNKPCQLVSYASNCPEH